MKRHLPWALCASFVVVACAANEELDFLGPSTENPNSSILGDAATSTEDSASSTTDGGEDVFAPPSAVCGDGKKAGTEECDDGNTAAGDGCSDTCKAESTGPEDVCPGIALALTGTGAETRKGSVNGQTSGTFPHYAGSCGGGTGRDSVYVITPDVTGLLTAKLTSTYDSILYAQRTCGDSKTEAACHDAAGSKGGETIKLAVTQGQPVYLVVDGYSGSSGTFTLDVELATAFCGNGVAEAPEACDDGNTTNGDGCSSTCALESGGVVFDCPGQGVLLTGTGSADRKISFTGDTTKLGSTTNTVSPAGCTGSGVNAVYAITPDVDGSLTANLVAGYDNATLHIRTECDIADTQLDCREATEPLEGLTLTVPVTKGLPTYVVVDASSTTYKGTYVLDVAVKPGACGNKILDGAEQCDDGNAVSGDGCTSSCTLEPISPAADKCPGQVLPVTASTGGSFTGIVTSSTETMASDYREDHASCASTVLAKDAVFAVTSPIDGLLEASVKGAFDTVVYVRNGCDTDAAAFDDLACADDVDGNGPETVHAPIKANETVWIIVDGDLTASAGVFELGVKISPAVCGNGSIEGGETCDDANASNNDGCSSTCQLEPNDKHDTCANAEEVTLAPTTGGNYGGSVSSGNTNLGHEQSFSTPSGNATGTCSSAGRDAIYKVTAPITGVMTVEVPVATFNVTLGARADGTCPSSTTATMPMACSNVTTDDGLEEISFSVEQGKVYYLIVDSPAMTSTTYNTVGTFTMLVNVRPPGCGDGLLAVTEQCDDGNTTNGDGCSSTCTPEALTGLDTCPGYALPLTGTGTEPRVGVVTIDTKSLAANYAGNCGGNSKDGVVVVTPPIDGKLTAKLTGLDYHAVLYARSTCADAATEKACDDDYVSSGVAIPSSRDITISGVKAGVPVYLFVDGFNGAAGLGRLNVTVTP
jgi:cysteine-rich repeat protein